MLQKLQIVENPLVGQPIFISPSVEAPWGGRQGRILRIVKNLITINFPGGVQKQFPKQVVFELIEEV
jgi:hypothetical protein